MSFPWSVNKFFSTWINNSNSITGTYSNVSLRVDGKTQLANTTTTALGVNKDSSGTYSLDVSGNSYSTSYFMDSAQSITQNGQLIPKIYADENLVTTIGKSRLLQSETVTATANLNYYWDFGDPQLIVFVTNAGPVNIYLPNVTASNIGATFTIKKELQTMNAFAYTGFTYVNESNQALSSGVIAFSTVRVITFTAISTTGSQWAITYSQAPNFQTVCTLTNGQTFTAGAKIFDTNTTFSAPRTMTINAQATFNTILPTTSITIFSNSNQFITKGFADSTYASGSGFMDLTTNQTAGGIKTFSSPPIMSGASITAGTIPTSAVASGFMDLATNQNVDGIKTFFDPPVMSGASISASSIPTSAVASGFVDLSSSQTITGEKTFTSAPVMSGTYITAASIPQAAVFNLTTNISTFQTRTQDISYLSGSAETTIVKLKSGNINVVGSTATNISNSLATLNLNSNTILINNQSTKLNGYSILSGSPNELAAPLSENYSLSGSGSNSLTLPPITENLQGARVSFLKSNTTSTWTININGTNLFRRFKSGTTTSDPIVLALNNTAVTIVCTTLASGIWEVIYEDELALPNEMVISTKYVPYGVSAVITGNTNWNTTPPTIYYRHVLFNPTATMTLTLPLSTNADVFTGMEFKFRRSQNTSAGTAVIQILSTEANGILTHNGVLVAANTATSAIAVNAYSCLIVCISKTATPYWCLYGN